MAKSTNCAFCGKEITKGFLKGDAEYLSFNLEIGVTCCPDCEKMYGKESVSGHERFGAKIYNYKKARKIKLSEKEIAHMFLQYLRDEEAQKAKYGNEIPDGHYSFFSYNPNGCFCVREFQSGFVNSDVSAKDMIKSMEKSYNYDSYMFDKNDITKIQYRRKSMGDPLGLFSVAYSYDIILNDEKEFSYKPCLTRTAMIGRGLPFMKGWSADKKIKKELELFKSLINSDLPIKKAR